MKRKYTSIAIANIIISLMFIMVGIGELKSGADPGSRFYYIDNMLIRILGLLFVVFSIGLLLRKEFARKCIIAICLISILEAIATYNYWHDLLDTVITFILFALVFVAPIIFFMNPKVRNYFNASKEELKAINEDETANYRHSGVGIASFVIAIINIISIISIIIQVSRSELYFGTSGQIITGILSVFIVFSGLIGLPLGIAGLFSRKTKKTLSIWGTIINSIFVLLFIIVVITLVLNYDQINDMINKTFEAMLF